MLAVITAFNFLSLIIEIKLEIAGSIIRFTLVLILQVLSFIMLFISKV